MGIKFERFYPAIGALVAAATYAVVSRLVVSMPPENFEKLVGAGVNLFSILAGFLCTALGLLLAMQEHKAIEMLRALPLGNGDYYTNLVSYLMKATRACFVATIFSGASLTIGPQWAGGLYQVVIGGWFAITTFALLNCWRVVRIFVDSLLLKQK